VSKPRKPKTKKSAVKLEEENRRLRQELELFRVLGDFDLRGRRGFSVDRLLSRFLTRAMKFFKTNAGTVFSLDPETKELIFKVVRGKARAKLKGMRLNKGEGIAGWVANRGRPRLARDVQKDPLWKREIAKLVRYPTKDILAVPLRDRSGKLVGVLELLNKKDHIGFTKKDLQDLVAISGSVGQLLENARLLAETHRRNQQLRLLNRVGHLVNSSLDPRQVRRRTIDAAIRLLKSEAGSLKEGEGIAGWVVKHGKPLIIYDCKSDPRWSRRVDEKSQFITRDMICVPVMAKGKAIGAIQAINKRDGRFNQEDVELLVVLSGQVAVALENARLFEDVQRTFLETSEALAEAIELRDAYTGGHTRRVTDYSLATGRQLGLKEDQMKRLRMAAILHDIGKIGVDDHVLRKPGRLDREEFAQMKKHPSLGADILDHIQYLAAILPGIRSHHERNDGFGYPDGLSKKKIPLVARIIAVADTYDAMTSDRPYRKGLSKTIAVQELIDCSGSQFDPVVVEAFLQAYRQGWITGRRERLPKRSGQKARTRGTRKKR
jgi:HD-GYP domain-containing protein (c-di-GMP phosphodiesterase class II)